ncbi:ulp1 protease family, C-terminal catalytic domain-containing protein [Tanacetum coccineum]
MHQSMEGIWRSGRFKGKGPVIEENTIDEAIDVDEYLSEEEGSEYSIEAHDDNRDDGASTSGIEVEGIPSKLGFYVVNNFDENTMEIKLENGSLLITMESIADMIGIINKGVEILVEDVILELEEKDHLQQCGQRVAERALAEIKSGGLGKGELEGPYVEEQDDPMPDNLEERCGFKRTFDAAKEMFTGNTIFADLEKQDETMASEGQEQSMEAGDHTGSGLDSPRYHLGPQTQAIVFETADKLYKESERKKLFDFSDKLSFSLGLTQDEYDMAPETHKEAANTSGKGVEGFSSGDSESSSGSDMEENRVKACQDPLDVVPLNFFSLKNEVMVRGRRAITLTERMKSPFFIRVVNADKGESGEEKRLANILFKKWLEIDVLFETKYGHQSLRGQIEILGPHEPVDDNVLSSWSAYLNFLEAKKDFISPARLFFPTFEVDKKLFADNAYTLEMFMEYAESANSSYGGQTKLDKADINPAVTLIDSKKEGNKVTRKKKKDGDINDVRVASKLCLYAINHGKAAEILECQLVHGNFSWQTNGRAKDCGIFLMRHMECFMGNDIGKWVCGLDVEGKKQNAQLGRLRNKYAAKLLLLDCNIYKGKIREEMDGK